MKQLVQYCTTLGLLSCCLLAVATEAQAQYSRRSPIVEAVSKTRASIVTIKVPPTQYGGRDSVGTGVIIDERGYLVTNRHVVGGRNQVNVRLSSGRELVGRVLLADPNCDLAVVYVQANQKLPALSLAPITDLMVGETVIAVGHPYGYTNTVSVGIISALNREITMPTGETLAGLIQTDASINPGNSGGPLLNINGELIGINVALREGAQGIAFAINSATVRDMLATKLSALSQSGVGHGMQCKEKVLGETGDRQRVVVWAVHHGTPASLAGLQQGDVIRAVGEHKVANRFDVERYLWGRTPGEQIKLQVVRGEEEISVTMTLVTAQALRQATTGDAVVRTNPQPTTQREFPADFRR